MSRPARLPARYTLFTRLHTLSDWLRNLGGRTRNDRATRLSLEAMEDRLVPTVNVWLSPLAQSLSEGVDAGVWVHRSGDTSQSLTVNLGIGQIDLGDPLAAAGGDYTLTRPSGGGSLSPGGGTVTFGAGEPSVYLSLAALPDNVVEGTEGFRVTVLPGGGYEAGSSGSGVSATADIRITDDVPVVYLSATSQTVAEGSSGHGIWVARNGGDTSQPLTVHLSIGQDGQNDPLAAWNTDYALTDPFGESPLSASGGTVTFGAGQGIVHLALKGLSDTTAEGIEGFRVTLQPGGGGYQAGWGPDAGGGRIADFQILDLSSLDLSSDVQALVMASSGGSGGSGGSPPPPPPPPPPPVTLVKVEKLADTKEGQAAGKFRFTRTGSTTGSLTVNYSVGGGATSGSDYTPIGTTVTFADGSATVDKVVSPVNDTVAEYDESVSVTLQSGSGYVIGSPRNATVIIKDNEQPVVVVEANPNAVEAERDGWFVFSRLGDTTQPLTVNYTVGGTATPGTDYAPLGTAVTFAANQGVVNQPVVAVADWIPDPNETVIVSLTSGTGYTLGSPNSATMTIGDKPLEVTVDAIGEASESIGVGLFRFRRTGPTAQALTASYQVFGSATPGADYAALSGTVTFAVGSATADVSVSVVDDVFAEAFETIQVVVTSSGSGYEVGSPSSDTLMIRDNDILPPTPPPGVVTVTPLADAVEGGSAGTFRFERTGSYTGMMKVHYTVGGTATSGSDYTPLRSSVFFDTGVTTVDVSVSPLGDTIAESDESVEVTLADGSAFSVPYTVGTPGSATLYIRDDDQPVVMVERIYDAVEGGDSGWFAFSRVGDTSQALTVNYAVGGSATFDTDYTPLDTVVTFEEGESVVYKEVVAVSDGTFDPGETVSVTIASGTGYTIDTANTATVTIEDATPAVSVEKVADAYEDGREGAFRFTRTGDLTSALTVTYVVSGTATSDEDYMSVGTQVTFAAGEAEVDVTVGLIDDFDADPGETVTATIQAATGYVVGAYSSASMMVVDDETAVVTVWKIADAYEGGSAGRFRFSRSGDTSIALTVSYTVSGTAASGTDYTALSGSVTFPANVAEVDVTVTPTDDAAVEGIETVIAAVTSGTTYGADPNATAVMNIADGDAAVGEIGGVLWDDVDGDGIREPGEAPLSGQAVNLLDENGVLLLQTVSDANGDYAFIGLVDGTYYIQILPPLDQQLTEPNQGVNDSTDSDVDTETNLAGPIVLTPGDMTEAIDAGVTAPLPPPPPPPGDIVVVFRDKARNDIGANNPLRIAKWHDAFEADVPLSPARPRLRGPDANGYDFIDRDDRRFNVWVYDWSRWNTLEYVGGPPAYPYATVRLSTENVTGYTSYDDQPTTISLVRIASMPGWYWSDSQILVSNQTDDEFPDWYQTVGADEAAPNDSLPLNKDKFIVSDRTHMVALGGNVIAVYKDLNNVAFSATTTVPVEKVVRLHITILKEQANATDGVISTEAVNQDVRRMREIYAQAGIRVLLVSDDRSVIASVGNAQVKASPEGVDLSDGGFDTRMGVAPNGMHLLSGEQTALFNYAAYRTPTVNDIDDIEVYYVNRIGREINGQYVTIGYAEALPLSAASQVKHAYSIVIGNERRFHTLAHEVAHILSNNGDHYQVNPNQASAVDRVNLLIEGSRALVGEGIFDSRRLTQQQIDTLRNTMQNIVTNP